MKLLKFYMNIDQTEPVYINPECVAYVHELDADKCFVYMTDGSMVRVYDSAENVAGKLALAWIP